MEAVTRGGEAKAGEPSDRGEWDVVPSISTGGLMKGREVEGGAVAADVHDQPGEGLKVLVAVV